MNSKYQLAVGGQCSKELDKESDPRRNRGWAQVDAQRGSNLHHFSRGRFHRLVET